MFHSKKLLDAPELATIVGTPVFFGPFVFWVQLEVGNRMNPTFHSSHDGLADSLFTMFGLMAIGIWPAAFCAVTIAIPVYLTLRLLAIDYWMLIAASGAPAMWLATYLFDVEYYRQQYIVCSAACSFVAGLVIAIYREAGGSHET